MEFAGLSDWRPKIETTLRQQYARWSRSAPPPFRPYLADLTEFTLRGGKRFRALLVLAGYSVGGGRDLSVALPAAAALEQFQSWMLVHDDIIDHSSERRGGPTLHRKLAERHRRARLLGDGESYGTGLAITLGDLQEPLTVDGILSVRVPVERRQSALQEYVRMTRDTAYGQLLDIQNGAVPPGEVSEADVLRVHKLKSAVYTVASPLRIGAVLAGAGVALLRDLEAVGVDLGIAFQLRDDVLGAGFDAAQSGKSANDLIEGKRTLLVVRAWARATAAERRRLADVLGNAGASPTAVRQAKELIRTTGSLDYSEKRIRQLTDRAYRRIDRSRSLGPGPKALLREIGERLVRRSV